jgi:hypothetical protein
VISKTLTKLTRFRMSYPSVARVIST